VKTRAIAVGLVLVAASAVIYWLCDRDFNSGHPDFFYLADAFLHGRTWLIATPTFQPGPNDIIPVDGRYYVPFGPFPGLLFMPLVALIGPDAAAHWETVINALLAAADVGLCWWLLGRLGVQRIRDRLWIAVLFGFSTATWWITTRGGVWHTGQLIAMGLTFLALGECWGRRRGLVVGLLGGAAFLSRAPLALALPFYGLLLWDRASGSEFASDRGPTPQANRPARRDAAPGGVAPGGVAPPGLLASLPWPRWIALGLGFAASVAFFFWYNIARFGSPFESGYALAVVPAWLAARRELGLFSFAHLGTNLDYLFWHLPQRIADFPYFRPDGLGMSIFLTSPGLFYAIRADFRSRRSWWLAGAVVATLVPSLFYYGGGWLQYGYRYALDAVPFAIALCGLAAARRPMHVGWKVLIAFGVVINLAGVYWAYNLR
jgi:hypothetical protein